MPSSDRIPMEGVLNCWNDEHDLPDLLLFVCRMKKTGKLAFSNPEGDKTLHIRNGKIVFAESSSSDDGLGHFLLRTGKISLMDYLRVSKLVEPGKRLGALLVAEGVMEPKDLAPAVLGQVRAIILGLFRRTESWYRFKEEALSSETITLDLPVESLVLDGVRQVESWRRISKGVGQLESQYQVVEDKASEWEGASFPPVVEELFEMLRSPTSVASICTEATLPDFEACRYLWAFRCLGWVEPVGRAKRAEAEADLEAGDEPREAAAAAAAAATAAAAAEKVAAMSPEASEAAREAVRRPTLGPPPEPEPGTSKPQPDSKFRRPTFIPPHLLETRVAVDTPAPKPSKSKTGTTQRITPAPVIPDFSEMEADDASSGAGDASTGPDEAVTATPSAPPPPPRPVPEGLAHTNLAIEPPAAKPSSSSSPSSPEKKEDASSPPTSPPRPPRPVPEGLAHTKLAVEPPETKTAPTPPPLPPPRPVPEDLGHTNLAIEPPPAGRSDESPRAVPEHLTRTRVSVTPPDTDGIAHTNADAKADAGTGSESTAPSSETGSEPTALEEARPDTSDRGDAPVPEPAVPSMADFATGGSDHTQIFTNDARQPAPPSTGEMMESILDGQSHPDIGSFHRMPPAASDDAATRFFDTPPAELESAPNEASGTGRAGTAPAGFEALAFDDSDPSVSSIEELSLPSHAPAESPAPPDTGATSEKAPGLDTDGSMAAFDDADLLYSPEPAGSPPPSLPDFEASAEPSSAPESDEPVVEATIVSEPEVPVVEAEPDAEAPPPVLAPPPPPRRKRDPDDGFDLDNDDFAHLITRNE